MQTLQAVINEAGSQGQVRFHKEWDAVVVVRGAGQEQLARALKASGWTNIHLSSDELECVCSEGHDEFLAVFTMTQQEFDETFSNNRGTQIIQQRLEKGSVVVGGEAVVAQRAMNALTPVEQAQTAMTAFMGKASENMLVPAIDAMAALVELSQQPAEVLAEMAPDQLALIVFSELASGKGTMGYEASDKWWTLAPYFPIPGVRDAVKGKTHRIRQGWAEFFAHSFWLWQGTQIRQIVADAQAAMIERLLIVADELPDASISSEEKQAILRWFEQAGIECPFWEEVSDAPDYEFSN